MKMSNVYLNILCNARLNLWNANLFLEERKDGSLLRMSNDVVGAEALFYPKKIVLIMIANTKAIPRVQSMMSQLICGFNMMNMSSRTRNIQTTIIQTAIIQTAIIQTAIIQTTIIQTTIIHTAINQFTILLC